MPLDPDLPRRSVLFVPGSRPRALAKASEMPADMIIVDLEDAVADGDKAMARAAAVEALAGPLGGREAGIRINAPGTAWHEGDVAAVARSSAAFVVLPKVEAAETVTRLSAAGGRPVLAMIESPAGVLAAPAIGRAAAGLIAGTNDLAAALRLPPGGRAGLALALQAIVLAARAVEVPAWDGVWNRLDDPDGLSAECAEGRLYGFDGKTLIHPSHVASANAAFGPAEAEVEDARALVAAASGGAERFRDRMIEAMHVAEARRVLRMAGG